jgi:hypothetical protein
MVGISGLVGGQDRRSARDNTQPDHVASYASQHKKGLLPIDIQKEGWSSMSFLFLETAIKGTRYTPYFTSIIPSIEKELAFLKPLLDLVDQIIVINRASHSLN